MPSTGAESRQNGAAAELPPPLVPAECSLSGYPSILIDIPRLRQSDFDATPNDTAWRAGVNLWFSAWESTPAGSLRGDDPALARAAAMGRDIKGWLKIRESALQGFVLCADGRFYHRTVCEVALGIWIDKLIRRHAGQRGNRGSQTTEERQAELRSIEQQISTAAACLRSLCATAPALTKAAKFPQCAPLSEPQCGQGRTALQPQEKGREGNGTPLANANGADPEEDIGKTLFDHGVGLLISKGIVEGRARGIVAGWQKNFGDAASLEAINHCRSATDPVSAIRARLGKAKRQAEYLGP